MTAIYILIFIAAWLACGVFAAGTVYGYVPIQIVEELIDSHGGMV